MSAYTLQLWADDRHEQYCGCWHVAAEIKDPAVLALAALGFGRFRDEDGTIRRAFFLPDEVTPELLARVRVTSGCYVEAVPV